MRAILVETVWLQSSQFSWTRQYAESVYTQYDFQFTPIYNAHGLIFFLTLLSM